MEDEKFRYSRNFVIYDYCYVLEGFLVYSYFNDIFIGWGLKSFKSLKCLFLDDKLGYDNGYVIIGLGMFDM